MWNFLVTLMNTSIMKNLIIICLDFLALDTQNKFNIPQKRFYIKKKILVLIATAIEIINWLKIKC